MRAIVVGLGFMGGRRIKDKTCLTIEDAGIFFFSENDSISDIIDINMPMWQYLCQFVFSDMGRRISWLDLTQQRK